uniref:Uncharacterized protein n=1 Tax=Siphoviridae sp. ctzpQ31 TaxID=2823613 RepID=A0A8S5L8B5_9CAUD|nr:MAG TPA: hypothetical protein [Siphoviridae sp. ctzpQ31]DAY03697.1 MAG TPA: hypothetical protein [Bacteriophage sp.]
MRILRQIDRRTDRYYDLILCNYMMNPPSKCCWLYVNFMT